jgi:hypothetical protein
MAKEITKAMIQRREQFSLHFMPFRNGSSTVLVESLTQLRFV